MNVTYKPVTYKDLTIESTIPIQQLHDLTITRTLNQHAKLYLTGILSEQAGVNPVIKEVGDHSVKVINMEGKVIFSGYLEVIETQVSAGFFTFEMEAVSATILLDIQVKSRTFQCLTMTYEDILNEIMGDYESAHYIDTASNGVCIPHLLIQYQETDWQFMKRLVSHFDSVIVADISSLQPRIFFGYPEAKTVPVETTAFVHRNHLDDYISTAQNFNRDFSRWDTEQYEIVSDTPLNFCANVHYRNRPLMVVETNVFIQNECLNYKSKLMSKDGAGLNVIKNERIRGATLKGTIEEVVNNRVRIYFEIGSVSMDGNYLQKENKHFFSFAGEQNNELGYHMSIPGSAVRVYFPTADETDGMVTAAVRVVGATDRAIEDNRKKCFSNEFGHEFSLDHQQLAFMTGNHGMTINMTKDGVVTVHSSAGLKLDAKNSIVFGSREQETTDVEWVTRKQSRVENLSISAENRILFQVGASGTDYILLDEHADVICKAKQSVSIEGKNLTKQIDQPKQEPKVSMQPALTTHQQDSFQSVSEQDCEREKIRNFVMTASAMDFVLEALRNQQIQQPFAPDGTLKNPMQKKYFKDDEQLFNSIMYGESVNG